MQIQIEKNQMQNNYGKGKGRGKDKNWHTGKGAGCKENGKHRTHESHTGKTFVKGIGKCTDKSRPSRQTHYDDDDSWTWEQEWLCSMQNNGCN